MIRNSLDRRTLLKTLGAGVAASLVSAPERLKTAETQQLWVPRFWDEKTRPQHVWENHEDRMYHDLEFADPELMTAPEFFAFMGQVWLFNRAMQWHREGLDGCIVCYSSGDLALTGEHQVSKWHSDPRNTLKQIGDSTRFEKQSGRRRDCAVVPAFQFHIAQNPSVALTVSEASAPWQFCASIKGRSGPPFISSGWRSGPAKVTFDVAAELGKRGYNLNFAEVHFVMGLWTDEVTVPAAVTYRLGMPAQAAAVPSLPVVRTERTARASGVPIVGVALDEHGERLGAGKVKMHAVVQGQNIALEESNGFWKGAVRGLKPGEYDVALVAEGAVSATGRVHLRVTDGEFLAYEKEHRSMTHRGKLTGPLTGSYQGTFYFRDAGLATERLINNQQEWDSWDRSRPPGEHLHYWESLTEEELNQRFSYLNSCGWDLLHLHQHWGIWERLDGGGRISPHGAEQVALYMRTAGKHGLALLQSLSSYEYAVHRNQKLIGGTAPWSVYVEAGFKDEDWYKPEGTTFQKMFHQYLSDFTSLFKEETALAGMLASGEGDHENGPVFTNDVFHYVKSHDPNHFFPAEPLFNLKQLPRVQNRGFEEELFGDRTYFIADQFLPEYDLGVFFKLLQTDNDYLAEGSWPTPNIYTALHYELLKNDHKDPGPESWTGTLRYRTRLRDTYYLGLVHRMPILDTWDEAIAEDEHIILRQVREQVDWGQRFMEPEVAICVDDWSAGEGRGDMVKYESFFARMPLAYRFILPEVPKPDNAAIVLDGRKPYQEPRFRSSGGALPDNLKELMPILLSDGYCGSYLWSEDRKTLLAYIYNTTHHTERSLWISGRFHRMPSRTDLTLKLQNLPAGDLKCRLYDLNGKQVLKQGPVAKNASFELGMTDKDYFVLVTPS